MLALLKRNLFIIVIFIFTILLAFLTFLTFIGKSIIDLSENNLQYLTATENLQKSNNIINKYL